MPVDAVKLVFLLPADAKAAMASGSVDAIAGEGICLSFRQAEALAKALAEGDLAAYNRLLVGHATGGTADGTPSAGRSEPR